MMVKLLAGSIVFCLQGISSGAQTWSSQFVQQGGKGGLIYTADNKGNRIPDFNRVGYHQRACPLPPVPVVKSLEPAGANSQLVIHQAVDELAAQPPGKFGYRGAILLQKGVYPIVGTIQIPASGIVLRGEGDDTRLVATGKGQRNLINVMDKGRLQKVEGRRRRITTAYVPVGATSFEVEHTRGLSAGSKIVVFRPGTAASIHDLKMDQIQVRDSGTRQWQSEEYDLHFERQVTRIENHHIFINNLMKFSALHPSENTFNWNDSDYLVSFAQTNNKRIHGHALLWHHSVPSWVTNFQGDSAAWEALMKTHITSCS